MFSVFVENWYSLMETHIVSLCSDKLRHDIPLATNVMHSFLHLWTKLVKQYLTLAEAKPDRQRPTANLEKAIYNLLFPSAFLLDLIQDGQIPDLCFAKALDVVNRSLPYGSVLARHRNIASIYGQIGEKVLEMLQGGRLFAALPVLQQKEGFGVQHFLRKDDQTSHKLDPSSGFTPHISATCLRSWALACVKSLAIVARQNSGKPCSNKTKL